MEETQPQHYIFLFKTWENGNFHLFFPFLDHNAYTIPITVDTLICRGIGGSAQAALVETGIKLYGGVSGDADAAVSATNEL